MVERTPLLDFFTHMILFLGFLLAVVAVAIIAMLSYQSLQTTTATAANLTQTVEVLGRLESLLSTLIDAETGQRGFLLTGEESYLAPYTDAKDALPDEIRSMRTLLVNRPEQRRRLDALESLANLKMAELESTVAARRAGKIDAALAVVRTDRGKIYMDRIRAAVSEMEAAERQLLAQRAQESRNAATVSLGVTLGGSGMLLFLIAGAAVVASRDFRTRQAQAWIRSGQMGLSEQMQGDQSLDKLGANLLGFLAGFVEAQVGAAYIAEAGQYQRFAAYADRRSHWAEMMEGVESWSRAVTTENCLAALNKEGVPSSAYRTVGEALRDPQIAHRGALSQVEDAGGNFKVLNLPFRMSGAKVAAGKRIATLGEHTRALLKEAGLSEQAIAAFSSEPTVTERN